MRFSHNVSDHRASARNVPLLLSPPGYDTVCLDLLNNFSRYFHLSLSLSLIIRDSFRLRCSRLLRRNRQDQKRNDIRKPAIRSVVRAACILRRHLVRSASGKQKCHHGRRKKQRCPFLHFCILLLLRYSYSFSSPCRNCTAPLNSR